MSEYEEEFNKIHFFKSQNAKLPDKMFESPRWTIPELQHKKRELNKVKGLLGKYKIKVWSKHTANRDKAGFVMKKLSEKIKPELLTQAWCKFYEILANFPVVPLCAVNNTKLESVHLCEAPGAFICALNHYLVLNYPGLEWTWDACTLNPNYEGNKLNEMIPDDRFIRQTLDKWIFGKDLSGDITKFYNHEYLVDLKKDSKVSVVTADGSVDCMSNPGEQECSVEWLHFCETVTALKILQPGGTFVIKIFTMFEDSTINLLYLLNCLFDKVAVFKPCTSKSGNSEVYVINTRYRGFNLLKDKWGSFISTYKDFSLFKSKSMFRLDDLPTDFIQEIHNCADFFMKKQIDTILKNIYNFEHNTNDNIYMVKSFVAQIYLSKYDLKPIRDDLKIVPNVFIADTWRIHSSKRSKQFYKIPVDQIIANNDLFNILDIKLGKEISTVYNSKFVHNDNLKKVPSIFNNIKNESNLYTLIYNTLNKTNIIINIKDFNYTTFSNFQKDFFNKILDVLSNNKNIIMINIPFITHFLVALFYLLFFIYEKVFIGNGTVLFYNFKSDHIDCLKKLFTKIGNCYKKDSNGLYIEDIVQIIPPKVFDNNSLIEIIWNYNNRLFLDDKCFVRPITESCYK